MKVLEGDVFLGGWGGGCRVPHLLEFTEESLQRMWVQQSGLDRSGLLKGGVIAAMAAFLSGCRSE